jgi:hypothetical protein
MPAAKKPVLKEIQYILPTGKPAYKVVATLQDRFKSEEKTNADGKVVAPRKLQGRLLIESVVDAVFQYASPETLDALAEDVRSKGDGEKAEKASEYIAAVLSARPVASEPGVAVNYETMTDEQIAEQEARIAAVKAKREEAKKAGSKTKDVQPV